MALTVLSCTSKVDMFYKVDMFIFLKLKLFFSVSHKELFKRLVLINQICSTFKNKSYEIHSRGTQLKYFKELSISLKVLFFFSNSWSVWITCSINFDLRRGVGVTKRRAYGSSLHTWQHQLIPLESKQISPPLRSGPFFKFYLFPLFI